jgi:cytidylate kinase
MKTLLEDMDDLDRMVDTGAPKDAVRSQIRLVAREVAALQTDYSGLEQLYSDLHAGLEERIAKLRDRDKKALRDWFQEQAQKQAELRKRYTLT